MAINSIAEYKTDPTLNTDCGGLSTLGSAPVSNFDDIVRTIMAHVAAYRDTLVPSATMNKINGQITFPAVQTPSTNPNVLDDYEEGTFTPTLSATGTELTVNHTTAKGTYVKIGGLLTYWFEVVWSSQSGGTGQARLLGMPFEPTVGGLFSSAIRANGFSAYAGKTLIGNYNTGPQLLLSTTDAIDIAASNLPVAGSLIGSGCTRVA